MAGRARLEIAERHAGASVTVALTGALDLHTAALLTQRLTAHLDGPAMALTLDLSELAFTDSSGPGLA